MKRSILLVPLLLLVSCGREVPLRLGPTSLIHDFAQLEIRVWRAPACPASPSLAAGVDHPENVAVTRYYTAISNATGVGVVPSGTHAVTALVRDTSCNVAVYGCVAGVDFASTSSVDITWAAVSPTFGCPAGYACSGGSCYQPLGGDAGM